jgi:hypothetical protein
MEEQWKDVEGFIGQYQISNLGRVKSLERLVKFGKYGQHRIIGGIILKPNKTKCGYLLVHLSNNVNKKTFNIARLVAISFIPNPDDKPTVNHIDANKENNRVDNLEWATYSENELHAYRIGVKPRPIGELHPAWGKHPSEETRAKLRIATGGERNPMFGKQRHHSEETRAKMKLARKGKPSPMKGKYHSIETRIKFKEITSGENNPMFGKYHSEATKDKIRQRAFGRKASLETREKMKLSAKKRRERERELKLQIENDNKT